MFIVSGVTSHYVIMAQGAEERRDVRKICQLATVTPSTPLTTALSQLLEASGPFYRASWVGVGRVSVSSLAPSLQRIGSVARDFELCLISDFAPPFFTRRSSLAKSTPVFLPFQVFKATKLLRSRLSALWCVPIFVKLKPSLNDEMYKYRLTIFSIESKCLTER